MRARLNCGPAFEMAELSGTEVERENPNLSHATVKFAQSDPSVLCPKRGTRRGAGCRRWLGLGIVFEGWVNLQLPKELMADSVAFLQLHAT